MPCFSFPRWSRVAALSLLLPLGASAQAPEPVSLAQAQQLAADRSWPLRAQTEAIRGARELAAAAGQRPDPVLRLGIDNLPASGPDRLSLARDFMTMRRIGLMQELPRADKRQARSERAQQDVRRAEAERQLALANLQRDTAIAWLDRLYSQRQRELLLQQREEALLQTEAAELAQRTGRGTLADVLAARAAALGLEDRLAQTDSQLRNATLALARWIGEAAERPGALPALAERPWRSGPAVVALEPQHLRAHPQMALQAAQVGAAEAELQLAEAGRRADWTVEAGYSQRGPAYPNMLSFGLSIPLQWDAPQRQDREVAARLAQLAQARAGYEDMLRAHATEWHVLQGDWAAGLARLDRYERQLLPLARQRVDAALSAYRGGKGDLGSVLLARREALELQIQALGLEQESARSWAQLEYLSPVPGIDTPHQEQP